MANKTSLGESLLDEIAAAISFHLKKSGITEGRAVEIGADVAEKVRVVFGGQALYIPLAMRQRAAARDAEICAGFTGNNQAELATKHGVSVVHIYRIIKREQNQRRRHSHKGQS